MIAMQRIVLGAILLVLMLAAAVFAYMNPQPVTLDLGFMRVERVSLALAFVGVFAAGWLFGLMSAAFTLWRSVTDRRRLRNDLRYAESELKSLRTLPFRDE